MRKNKFKHHSSKKSGLTFGVILVLLGMVFLAFNFGILDGVWGRVVFSWQMLIIAVGFVFMFYQHVIRGLAFISVGIFFIMPRLSVARPDVFCWVTPDFTHAYWPVLLIIAGVLILLHIVFCPQRYSINRHVDNSNFHQNENHYRKMYANRPGFERNSVFGNVEEIILDPEFKDGEINAVFGEIILDLRKTALSEGETSLELNAVFGGVTIFIPENWHVELHLSCVFGGFRDNRILLSENIDHSRKLVIVGACIFGGGEIRN